MNQHQKSTPIVWVVIALLAMLLLYPLSYPPACWLCRDWDHLDPRVKAVEACYAPLYWLESESPVIARAMAWYYLKWMEFVAIVDGLHG